MLLQASMLFSIADSDVCVIDSRRSSVPASIPCSGERNSCEIEEMKSPLARDNANASILDTSAMMELPNADRYSKSPTLNIRTGSFVQPTITENQLSFWEFQIGRKTREREP